MSVLEKLKLKQQIFSEKEKKFLEFLNGNENYKNNFRFFYVYSKANKELLYSMFEGLLKEMIIVDFDNYSLIIYHNKERVILHNYLDTLSEDFGIKMGIFEGFLVNKDNNCLFKDFIYFFEKINLSNVSYTSIRNLILDFDLTKEERKILKDIVLNKYLKDNQFMRFLYALFENNLNVSKTAKNVFMHRNTVNNKLASFENDTTLVLQNFKDAIVVYELLK